MYDGKSNTKDYVIPKQLEKLWQKDYVMQKELECLYSKNTNEHKCLQFNGCLSFGEMPFFLWGL